MPLIAYNINLATDRLDVAKKIAAAIRHSSGGFRYVKAAGFKLADRGIVQVSMNLTNYEKTPIVRVFEAVKREAARYGVAILESEIVGLVPSAALTAAAEFYLQIEGFTPDQVLENKLTTDVGERPPLDRPRPARPGLPASSPRLEAPRRRDAERLHLPIQVAPLDAEDFRGARHVALLLGERAQDQVALEAIARFVQRQLLGGDGGELGPRHRGAVEEAQVGGRNRVARHHDHQPLDDVAQLAHVAGPGVVLQHRDRPGVEAS